MYGELTVRFSLLENSLLRTLLLDYVAVFSDFVLSYAVFQSLMSKVIV